MISFKIRVISLRGIYLTDEVYSSFKTVFSLRDNISFPPKVSKGTSVSSSENYKYKFGFEFEFTRTLFLIIDIYLKY